MCTSLADFIPVVLCMAPHFILMANQMKKWRFIKASDLPTVK